MKDYIVFRRDRTLKHACSIHVSLKAKIVYVSTSDHLNQPEFMILDIASPTGAHLLLSVVYRRPNGNLLNEFFEIHSDIASRYKNFIITGDLNCDLLTNSFLSNHLKTFISELSLHSIPYGATHHTRNKDSWLDVVLLDNNSKQGMFFESNHPFICGHDYLFCEYVFDMPKKLDKFITC